MLPLKHVKEKGTSKISVCNFVYTYHRHYTFASIYSPVFIHAYRPYLCFVFSNPGTRMPSNIYSSHPNGGWLPENRWNWWNWTTWKIVTWRNLLVDLMNFDSEHLKFKSLKTLVINICAVFNFQLIEDLMNETWLRRRKKHLQESNGNGSLHNRKYVYNLQMGKISTCYVGWNWRKVVFCQFQQVIEKIHPLKNHPKTRHCFLKEIIWKKVNANEIFSRGSATLWWLCFPKIPQKPRQMIHHWLKRRSFWIEVETDLRLNLVSCISTFFHIGDTPVLVAKSTKRQIFVQFFKIIGPQKENLMWLFFLNT